MKDALIDPTTQTQALTSWVANPKRTPENPSQYLPVYTPIPNSARVCEVVALGGEFPVAEPLFWTSCADDVVADQWYYDTQTTQIVVVPDPAPYPVTGTSGTQTV
jgi:hypothetical protein